MVDKPTLWYAEITCWKGVSIGAIHHYVSLRGDGREVRLEWVLDENRATEMTARESGWTWKPGHQTNRFDTREEAKTAAKLAFDWLCTSQATELVGRDKGSADPVPFRGRRVVDMGARYLSGERRPIPRRSLHDYWPAGQPYWRMVSNSMTMTDYVDCPLSDLPSRGRLGVGRRVLR